MLQASSLPGFFLRLWSLAQSLVLRRSLQESRGVNTRADRVRTSSFSPVVDPGSSGNRSHPRPNSPPGRADFRGDLSREALSMSADAYQRSLPNSLSCQRT